MRSTAAPATPIVGPLRHLHRLSAVFVQAAHRAAFRRYLDRIATWSTRTLRLAAAGILFLVAIAGGVLQLLDHEAYSAVLTLAIAGLVSGLIAGSPWALALAPLPALGYVAYLATSDGLAFQTCFEDHRGRDFCDGNPAAFFFLLFLALVPAVAIAFGVALEWMVGKLRNPPLRKTSP